MKRDTSTTNFSRPTPSDFNFFFTFSAPEPLLTNHREDGEVTEDETEESCFIHKVAVSVKVFRKVISSSL